MNNWKTKLHRASVQLSNNLRRKAFGTDKYSEQLPFNGYNSGSFGAAGAGGSWDITPKADTISQYVRRIPILGRESFSSAFNRARTQGEPTFIFNGEEYTTEISDNPQYVGKRYQDTIDGVIREVLDENMKSIPDSTRIEPYVGQMLGIYKRNLGGILKPQSETKLPLYLKHFNYANNN